MPRYGRLIDEHVIPAADEVNMYQTLASAYSQIDTSNIIGFFTRGSSAAYSGVVEVDSRIRSCEYSSGYRDALKTITNVGCEVGKRVRRSKTPTQDAMQILNEFLSRIEHWGVEHDGSLLEAAKAFEQCAADWGEPLLKHLRQGVAKEIHTYGKACREAHSRASRRTPRLSKESLLVHPLFDDGAKHVVERFREKAGLN